MKTLDVRGSQCGKYLHATMHILLDLLKAHGEPTPVQDCYTTTIRNDLLAMSLATIDSYLGLTRS